MGEKLLQQMMPFLEKTNWPGEAALTLQGREAYLIGLDKVETYTSDPKTLAEAIRVFHSGGSLPYAYAGAAYVLVAASREQDGSYALTGLDAAMAWLEKAQTLEMDSVDINMIEAFVYVYNGRSDDARLVIDYLLDIEPGNYHVHLADVAYWIQQGDLAEIENAITAAVKTAVNPPQKMRLTHQLGDIYLQFGELDKALAAYKQNVHFDPKNPLLWHKISVVFYQMENWDEAERANQQSLRLGTLVEAQAFLEQIKQRKKQDTGLFGGLFNR
ncbi:MAG: tetratricopeptide repeat protein [Anaerolineae bacterium]|nr:tetratricopeptide repeat protein [Anaerolineae bacterium]